MAKTDFLLAVDHQVAPGQEYYGPYNVILNHVFTFEEHYVVNPQPYPILQQAVDYPLEFLVMTLNSRVVMGVEIKRENDLVDKPSRRLAHTQVLDRFYMMRESLQIPVFVIVSVFGRYCRIYRYTQATRTAVPDFMSSCNEVDWDIDLATLQGRRRLNDVFDEVKQMTQQSE
ncbi:hypothetical protein BGZ99_003293 [Dissophora globulifera]|uniref:Uncharacterized protein n=1 Tax=Dissophora globulifera TaxID=979702 RepID=A0A9P6RXV0_9FUNG|nr:hypothetical protein BGZ99_003293 [Dissophora globulifera]